MDTTVVSVVIGGCLVGGAISVKVLDRLWPSKGSDQAQVVDAIKELTAVTRESRDRLVGIAYESVETRAALSRIEQSQAALHRRIDVASGGPRA